MRESLKNLRFSVDTLLAERDRSRPLAGTSKTLYNTIQYNTMKNLHSKTDKHTVSLI